MWHQRVIYGTLLIAGLFGLFALDAGLSADDAESDLRDTTAARLSRLLMHGGLTTAIVLAAATLGVREGCALVRATGHRPADAVVILAAVAMVVTPWLTRAGSLPGSVNSAEADWRWTGITVAAATLLSAVYVMARYGVQGGIANTAVSVLLILYVGFLAAFAVRLRQEWGGPAGAWTLLYVLLVTKSSDIGAYAAGRWFGRTRVVPGLSPNKTLEGFIGGLVFAVLIAWGINRPLLGGGWMGSGGQPLPGLVCVVLGAVIGVVAPLGDLFESLIKRDAGAKDSGRIRPFGGVLDMIDSPLFALPVGWWLLTTWARSG